ncbi:MAG: ribosome-associated translation inhibitor RaiA [Planctomycetota bacterium]|nr:ribosome-associated translation inhibitor RaiA [Phycisphaerales bacterium]
MRIEVVGRHLDITDAIRQHAEEKAEKLTRFYDRILAVTWTIEHHNVASGGSYQVELLVDVEHHDDLVSKDDGSDLYGVIDGVHRKGIRQLSDLHDKVKLHKRQGH